LSLGQKQRVCIARAIFRERPILLFDDPFSSLDTVTEERILNNLLDHREIGATFLVSQRASTLNRCDDLLVFHDGRLQAHGPPKELSRAENFFAHIFELQKSLEGA
ncbi:ATP-binding cassette domain-containing protein, partial [bacterium]|nr:ATP-binding cassette domain-containing protein [bacterium]